MKTLIALTLATILVGCGEKTKEPEVVKCIKATSGPCSLNGEWLEPAYQTFHTGQSIPEHVLRVSFKDKVWPVSVTFAGDVLVAREESSTWVTCWDFPCLKVTVTNKTKILTEGIVLTGFPTNWQPSSTHPLEVKIYNTIEQGKTHAH